MRRTKTAVMIGRGQMRSILAQTKPWTNRCAAIATVSGLAQSSDEKAMTVRDADCDRMKALLLLFSSEMMPE